MSSRRALTPMFLTGALLAGCSSSGSDPQKSGEDPLRHARPPAAGPAKAADGSGDVVLAVSRLYLGDTDPDGTANPSKGWMKYGYDIDGKVSTADSTDLCRPRANANPKSVYPDGNDGIDNSFGRNLLPILLGLQSDASSKMSDGMSTRTLALLVLPQLGSGADYNPLDGRVYQAAKLVDEAGAEFTAKWDGTDRWPIAPESLENPGDPASAKLVFHGSYVTGNTWVSGEPTTLTGRLDMAGFGFDVTVTHAVLTAELSADHRHATKGILSGVLSTDALLASVRRTAGAFDRSLCSGPTIDSILAQIEQASDILGDGTQDPSKPCDGISIGIGFDAEAVLLGNVGAATEPTPDPCQG